MSIETFIRPKKKLESLDQVLDFVANMKTRNIMVLPNESIYKIHIPDVSIKQIEYCKESGNNYSVRITTLACKEDWELYKDTIKAIIQLTSGTAYYENENESRIDDVDAYFNDEYIKKTILRDWEVFKLLVNAEKTHVGTYCPFGWYYIGKEIISQMEDYASDLEGQIERLWYYIRVSQYELTHPRYTPKFEIESKEKKTLTGYSHNDYDYISYADLFAVNDGETSYVIPYEKLAQIKPMKWVLFDEVQYRARELNIYEWKDFVEKMKKHRIF